MVLKDWIVAKKGTLPLIGSIDLPDPHDLATALEFGGRSLGTAPDDGEIANCYGIELMWGDLPYFLNVCPGAGCWEIWACYEQPRSSPVAFLYYKDDSQFSASSAHPMYHPHEPVWDRGWLAMLEQAEVVER